MLFEPQKGPQPNSDQLSRSVQTVPKDGPRDTLYCAAYRLSGVGYNVGGRSRWGSRARSLYATPPSLPSFET